MVKIVTVTHDAPRFINLCVRGVHHFTNPGSYRHVVIDNGSSPKTIGMLRKFHKDGWIDLRERSVPKNAKGHADSLDWFLQSVPSGEAICLLDSDAYPTCHGWLEELVKLLEGVSGVGYAHFRDNRLLHPACMLFRACDFITAGRPSCKIFKRPQGLCDTAMLVSEKLLEKGFKLRPLAAHEMPWVKHRWCGTRVEIARGTIEKQPVAAFNASSDRWFLTSIAREILGSS